MKRLLLVEDDTSLGATLQERLQKENYVVDWVQNQKLADDKIKNEKWDLIILDLSLPDGSGFSIAKKSRNSAPFIFMTALNTAENRLEGFELGAEEFIPKPFHLKELLLRVKHVLDNHAVVKQVTCGDKVIDFDKRAVIDAKGNSEFFQTRDFEILKYLIEASPRVISRDEMLDKVLGEDKFPTHRTIDNSILRIRQILGDTENKFIRSARGVGYQWLSEDPT